MTVKFRAKGKGRARPKQHKGVLTVDQWRRLKSGDMPTTKRKSKKKFDNTKR